jgi:hypothetical protein
MDKSSPFDKYIPAPTGTPYADMTSRQKTIFVVKLIACICTFGFAFPNVQSD